MQGAFSNGDELTYSARPLPPGSLFDTKRGVLTWLPGRDQEGKKHTIEFEVTDGHHVTAREVVFIVAPNRGPYVPNDGTIVGIARESWPEDPSPLAGDDNPLVILAQDWDNDELRVTPRSVPAGALLTSSEGTVTVSYRPRFADIGVHELVADVSDGESTRTIRRRLVALPDWAKGDRTRFLLLAGGPAGFVAHGDGELFAGGALEVSFVAHIEGAAPAFLCAEGERHRGCHPSHRRFYAEFELLDSLRSGQTSLFTYGAGYSSSFEYFPVRRWLIPHYGIELGALYRDGLGHRVQTRPYLGLHLWADDRLWLNATLGYRVVPAELHAFSGPTAALRAVVHPW